MKENGLPVISVEEIMKKIEEEIGKQKGFLHDGRFRSDDDPLMRDSEKGVNVADLLSSGPQGKGLISGLLWKYGTRYAVAVKKVPGLKTIAEYFYWRLSGNSKPLPRIMAAPPVPGADILPTNLNFDGFLEQLRHEGLKGKIKRQIFEMIGFFAWWQGQVNTALYKKLSEQEAKLSEQEAKLSEQEARLAEQEARLAERDEVLERLEGTIRDLGRKLSVLSQLEDAVYEELITQRAEMARQRGWSGREMDA